MRTITVRLRAVDLSREMVAMRVWLDRNAYAAARFDCDQHGNDVVVSVDFRMDAAAEAFAKRFGGKDGRGGHPRPQVDAARSSAP
jgi:hypothetical protein